MNIEKIKTWINENSGFFGGEFPPAVPAATYFTESNFLSMGYPADEIAGFLVELNGDWDQLATIAAGMVGDEIANTADTVETWLPLHPGYYESRLYHSDMDNEEAGYFIQSELPELPEYLHAAIGDKIETDFTGYMAESSHQFCDAVEALLTDILGSKVEIKYQGIHSPREYNFTTDTVNVAITLDRAALVRYCTRYGGEMAPYFKARYTSYDGFISHYPANIDYWTDPDHWDRHGLGAILEAVIIHHYGDARQAEEAALDCVDTCLSYYMSLPPAILGYLQSDAMADITALVEKQQAECDAYKKIMTGRLAPDELAKIVEDARELAEIQARETLTKALEEL